MVNQLVHIDLFSGCGGISLGLHNAGWRGIFAIEKNPDAFATLQHNLIYKEKHFKWPSWLAQKDWTIDRLLHFKHKDLIRLQGKIDLVVGGPPCQGFSVVGKRTASDIRNQLINSYLRFVEIVRPRVVMFENVKGFTLKFLKSRNHKKIAYSEVVISKLRELGYEDARGEMLDMSEYGVPQTRKRFVVIATQANNADDIFSAITQNRSEFFQKKGLPQKNSVADAISDLENIHGTVICPDSRSFTSGITSKANSELQRYLRLSQQEFYVPNSHRFVNHTKPVIEIFENLLRDAPRNKIIRRDERETYGIKKRSVTVLCPEEPAGTVTTIPDDYVHYSEPRVMTPRECARLQTFPDWFEFRGPYTTGNKERKKSTPRYTQIGNAVPPLFAEQLGIAIRQALTNECLGEILGAKDQE